MDQIVNVNEFQGLAKRALPKMYYDFYSGGAEDEHTLKENVEAFTRIMFRPRVLVDVSKIDTSTRILGYPISSPIMIAPTAMHMLAHPQGETQQLRVTLSCLFFFVNIQIVSFMASCTIEEVASSGNAVKFLQIYVYKQREVTAQMVKRAEKAGFKALVLTVDVPKLGRREADIKNKLISPKLKKFEGLFSTELRPSEGSGMEAVASRGLDASFSWKDIEWLRSITKLPIVVKGILTREDGEIATARAAAACNTIMIVSYMSSCTIEEVASSCNAVRFLQIYVFKKHEIAQMVIRAEKAGFKAIVLTNAPRIGKREADIKNKMISPQLKNFGGLFPTEVQPIKGSGLETLSSTALDSSFGWKDIEWLRSITKLPILIKGILTREDALKAVEAGVDGIVISNHGGRQLDYSPATITVLEEVVHVVRGRIPVLFDGGVRRGTDVFKALALGAQAVLIGRPLAYALAAKGEDGVKQGIEMLKNEFELTMALSGSPTIGDITRNHVKAEAERLHSML
ncbi:unnamed protein product [Brassica rapa]|uniref:(S)-2-hydroxy-acid oxidase n=1 Tax=Brassica campestris TaxID=3711 RepID=A0A8D9DPS7_BRACM|nr:unnamed protein product [Brassica rapa]